jgi:hypothetical protein
MNDGGVPRVQWRILTPTTAPGAVAIIGLEGSSPGDIDSAVDRLGLDPVPVGRVSLQTLSGHDRGLVARWSQTCLHVMPHGGSAVVREVTARLSAVGIPPASIPDPVATYPEAQDRLEALMLHALALAESPLAIDLLLDQPRRWHSAGPGCPTASRALHRLITPPVVVAVGPSNIGKSTFMNALAGRYVSIVADEPGTTRDHVGAALNLGGLVVRYADTPGIRATQDPIEREVIGITGQLAAGADLLLLMGDTTQPPPRIGHPGQSAGLTVALRADLGVPDWPYDIAVCSPTGQGLPELVNLIKEQLVPRAALDDARPWRFWDALGMEYRPGEP